MPNNGDEVFRGKHLLNKILYLKWRKKQEEDEEELRKSNKALKENQEDNGSE